MGLEFPPLILTIALFSTASFAQIYPAKVVRLLVPFSAGSGSDTIGRIYAGGLSEVFGQQAILENRAGDTGSASFAAGESTLGGKSCVI